MVVVAITDIEFMQGPHHKPNPRVVPRPGSGAPARPRVQPRPGRQARPLKAPKPPKAAKFAWPRIELSERAKAARRSVLRFVAWFVGIFVLFYAGTMLERKFLDNGVWQWYLHANAYVAGGILNHFDQFVTVEDDIINSSRATLKVAVGCDAVYPTALFAAAVLATPFAWGYRILGVMFGAFSLAGLNIIRILTLYYIRAEHPTVFNVVHIDVWQALFIFLTVLLWIFWAFWAARRMTDVLE